MRLCFGPALRVFFSSLQWSFLHVLHQAQPTQIQRPKHDHVKLPEVQLDSENYQSNNWIWNKKEIFCVFTKIFCWSDWEEKEKHQIELFLSFRENEKILKRIFSAARSSGELSRDREFSDVFAKHSPRAFSAKESAKSDQKSRKVSWGILIKLLFMLLDLLQISHDDKRLWSFRLCERRRSGVIVKNVNWN